MHAYSDGNIQNKESRGRRMRRSVGCCLLIVGCLTAARCSAGVPNMWEVYVGAVHVKSIYGFTVGAYPGCVDGYEGGGPLTIVPGETGIFTLQYNVYSLPEWTGPTGFYTYNPEAPIPAYGSKSWWNIYMWSQNYTPDPANRILFNTWSESPGRPYGYWADLVLDYVPAEANWTGATHFWLDLGQTNRFELPIVTVSNPLAGVRMHITVYALVPEPSALCALALGLAGLAALRRRWW